MFIILKGQKKIDRKFFIDFTDMIYNKHKVQYDYSKIINSTIILKEKIEIICIKHGKFLLKADLHLNGKMCPDCIEEIKKKNTYNIDLAYVSEYYYEQIINAFNEKDIGSILLSLHDSPVLYFITNNTDQLRNAGIYEEILIRGYCGFKTNSRSFELKEIKYLFNLADRKLLLKAGDPLPFSESFVIYRGVAGNGRSRRIRGISWTSSLDKAIWYAKRFDYLPNPSVYMTEINKENIYTYKNSMEEQEFLCDITQNLKLSKVWTIKDAQR